MFRKIPNGLRDVVSGKWGGRELEEYQGLVKWVGAVETCCVLRERRPM